MTAVLPTRTPIVVTTRGESSMCQCSYAEERERDDVCGYDAGMRCLTLICVHEHAWQVHVCIGCYTEHRLGFTRECPACAEGDSDYSHKCVGRVVEDEYSSYSVFEEESAIEREGFSPDVVDKYYALVANPNGYVPRNN